jgi:hydrogenase maturation protease
MIATGPAVVLGVGNVLLRDDGVGVRVVRELGRLTEQDPRAVPGGTHLVDGGTLGLNLLQAVRGARSLLLVDAVNLGRAPGAIVVLRGDAVATAGGGGTGSGGVGELLSMSRLMGWLPDPVTLLGIQAGDTGVGVGLSPDVEAAVPAAVELARLELRTLDELAAAGRSVPSAVPWQEGATA